MKPKSKSEINKIKQVEQITQQALITIVPLIQIGVTEIEIAQWLNQEMEKLGAEDLAFPTIVAFGVHSATPHHEPTSIHLSKNQVVLIDLGAKKTGYCGDLTRTTWIGKPDDVFQQRYSLVQKAQQAALAQLKPGNPVASVDTAVRKVFEQAQQLEFFVHATGHGVGLEIHEAPKLSHLTPGKLEPGMVLTIEPGLYYPDWGGIRIEDMVLITDNGFEFLSKPGELILGL